MFSTGTVLFLLQGLYERLDTAARAREDFTNRTNFPDAILDRITVHEKHASYKDDPVSTVEVLVFDELSG